jgi:PIN domain nuclease of toxin-antitoxin system
VKLLLDTHVAIWAVDSPKLLSNGIADLLLDTGNKVYVSVVSVWEIAIKLALPKRYQLPFTASKALFKFEEAGFELLGIDVGHVLAVERLPLLHGDPFDRLLVAQALSEPMRLISRDPRVAAYSDTVISW